MNRSLIWRVPLAGALGALLLWLGIWLVLYIDVTALTPQLTFTSDRLRLAGGGEGRSGEGLQIPPPPAGKPAVVILAESGFAAREYPQLSWDIPALPANVELALAWTSDAVAGRGHTRRISAAERAGGLVNLDSDPAWQGRIVQLGLLLKGAWTTPVVVRSLSLHRQVPSPMDVLISLWSDWTLAEPWTHRSINFHIGAARSQWLTPVTTLVLWVGTGLLVFTLLSRPIMAGRLTIGFAGLVLAAWFLLDARWQWQLGERLLATYRTYGGLTQTERAGAAPDGKIFAAVGLIKAKLPAEPGRIFIIHQENSAYLPGRIRYHLLPHASYAGLASPPHPEQVRPGDHLLVLANVTGVRYDRPGGRLVSGSGGLAVESRLEIPGFGTLYRVQGGN